MKVSGNVRRGQVALCFEVASSLLTRRAEVPGVEVEDGGGIRPGDQIHQIVKHLILELRNRDPRKTGENSQALWELKIKLAYFLDKWRVSVWFVHPGFRHLPKSSIHQHLSIIII